MMRIQDETYWSDIVSAFPILYHGIEKPESCDDDKFFSIKNMIIEEKIRNTVSEKVLNNIIKEMSLEIKNSFWPYFCNNKVLEGSFQRLEEYLPADYSGFELFKDAINKFYNLYQSYMNTIKRLQMLYEDNEIDMSKHFFNRICALLHFQLPANYIVTIHNFYRAALRIIMKVTYNFKIKKNVYKCTGCFFETDHCKCDYILNILYVTNGQLNTIGFFKSLLVDVIIESMNKVIQTEVELTIKLNFEYQQLFTLEKWLDCEVYNWIKRMFQPQLSQTVIIDNSSLDIIMDKLKHLLFKSFLKTRIQQLYEIILKYPYSKAVVIDLEIILKKIKLEPELYEIFRNILQSRLLQPLTNTIDILRVYMAAIKVLTRIDPTGLLLEKVTQLIREYLQIRKDTVRCIIIILTADNHHLIDDLERADNSLVRWKQVLDPFLTYGYESLEKIKETDVATLLVRIHESPKVFANEYKVLLADRLLSNSMKLSDEIYILNMLKTIFGNSLLQTCEVMIKDLFNSTYVDIHVYTQLSVLRRVGKYQYPVRALIVSEYYWPKFKNNVNVKLPKIIQSHLDFYKSCFEKYKKNQTLIWKPNIGKITLDIILNDEILHLTVNPIHATIIWHYQKQVEWTIENLSKKINVPITTLRCYITFWINQGLLIRNTSQSSETFTLVKKLPKRLATDSWQRDNEYTGHNYSYRDDGTTESAIVSAQEQSDEELQEFWLYIENTLKNRHCMSLKEIQRLLKVFFTQETELEMNLKCYLQELETLLDNKVKEQRLTFSDGQYTLVK